VLRIPLQREGGRLLVRARLDEGQSIRMLVDTGASISALKPQVVRGMRRGPEIVIRTAGGIVRAPVVTLNSLELDELRVESLTVAVMELADLDEADGILGMDVLGQLDLSLDQDAAALVIQTTP
ncbi:MAG: retropepsin-like aspartic protease, partial [Pseudomonadales bacterium]